MGRKGKRKAKSGSRGGADGGGSSKEDKDKPVENPCEITECSASPEISSHTENPSSAKDEQQEDSLVEKPAAACSQGLAAGEFPIASELERLAITSSRPSSSAEQGGSVGRPQLGSFISLPLGTPDQEPEYRSSICFGSISEIGEKSTTALKPVNRPDGGGKSSERTVNLLVNHFPVKFRPEQKIFHYDFDIQKKSSGSKGKEKKPANVSKEDAMEIKKLLGENFQEFRYARMVYDGKKNVYSAVPLPQGKYTVKLNRDVDSAPKEYIVSLKSTSHELSMQSLVCYLDTKNKEHLQLEQDLMQALDLVIREHPGSTRIVVGRSLYPKLPDYNIGGGLVAGRGFYQSLRPTAQGLILNVDYSVVAFRKSIPVLDYLRESCPSIKCEKPLSDGDRWTVEKTLQGLKIRVTHRKSTEKFTIRSLTKQITTGIRFEVDDDERQKRFMTSMLDYFRKKYNRDISFRHLPCLDLSKARNKPVYVPMEFCVICEGQRVPKDKLNPTQSRNFQQIACPRAPERLRKTMYIMREQDGPREGPFCSEFGLTVGADMTRVTGRVLAPPKLKLGGRDDALVIPNKENRQWNLMNSNVFDGKPIDKWGILYFSWERPYNILKSFATSLVKRCIDIGIKIAQNPLVYEFVPMDYFSDSRKLQQTLENSCLKTKGQLKILICIMEDKHPGYNTLKYIAETKIGLLTQCCLTEHVKKCSNTFDRKMISQSSQYLANLALKMNAKLGGSNTILDPQHFSRQLPRFAKSHVIYMGADVNHPGAGDKKSPSVAAVVGSMNWPLCTRYMAKIRYQSHRKEHIEHLETMSRDLLKEYLEVNKRLPDKIVFFRDGVSESQFEMVLKQELSALKEAISLFEGYKPTVSLIVAQKRHHTRLFLQGAEDSTQSGNVPAGTVVDTVIVLLRGFDFFMCSHHGLLGTSKPTHYHLVWDENEFRSDELQILINSLCYTFARCTKPVSLVPPVYYADLAAYRGRQYVEALMSSSSESSSSSSSSSSGLANYPEIQIQEAINKSMFFC